jgi:hypothetical protein
MAGLLRPTGSESPKTLPPRAAILFTGRPRCLDKTAALLRDHLLVPNRAVVFIACECPTEADRALVESVVRDWNEAPGVEVARWIAPTTYRTPAFNAFLDFILTHREATCPAALARQNNYPQSYLRTSGSVVEYEQFRVAQELMADWRAREPEAAERVQVIIRARFDVVLSQPLQAVRFFTEVDEPLLREFGEAVYVRSLGDRRIAEAWAKGEIRPMFAYPHTIPERENAADAATNPAAVLARIRHDPAIWTLYCQWMYVARPAVMASLASLVWEYGVDETPHGPDRGLVRHHPFNAENQFHFAVLRRGLKLYMYFTDRENANWARHEAGMPMLDASGRLMATDGVMVLIRHAGRR